MTKRTFEIVDDESENFTVARFTRECDELKDMMLDLEVGQYLAITDTRAYLRVK